MVKKQKSIESTIKSIAKSIEPQYSKIFKQSDWKTFKFVAEYYFKNAVHILKKDVDVPDNLKLWVRNIQKRLFIGIGCELLLKSLYLKNGYCINRIKKKNNFPCKIQTLKKADIQENRTVVMFPLINNLDKIHNFIQIDEIIKGLSIARAFRNKEGHIVTLWHKFNEQNYADIEKALIYIYKEEFNQKLEINISFKKDEIGIFEIPNL